MSIEFPVNTTTIDNQTTFIPTSLTPATQSVGMDANGNFVIAWSSQGQDGSGWGVYAQRFDPQGNLIGPEFKANTFTTGSQFLPSVGMADTTGEFVITWTSLNQTSDNGYGVYAQRYSAAGAPVGSEVRVNTTTTGNQQYSAVAMDADGDLVVTWTSSVNDGAGEGIVGRRYNKETDTWGAEFTVNETTAGDQRFSSIAMETNGDFVVTWTSGNGATADVYARRFSADGTPLGSEFRVNTTTANFQGEATVAMDADGDFVVAWADNGQDGNSYGIYAQRYNNLGQAVDGEFLVNTNTFDQQRRPNAAMDANGNFVISWSSFAQDTSTTWGVFAQRFDAAGAAQGDEFRLNDTLNGNQQFSPIAVDANGNLVAAWTSSGNQDGSGLGVYAKLVGAIPNTAPSLSNISKSGVEDTQIAFSLADFNAVFTDAESNNNLSKIKITALPGSGKLRLNGVDVTLNQEITAAAINNLVFVPNENYSSTDSFGWNASDGIVYAASSVLANLTFTPVNDAPTANPVIKAGVEDTAVAFTAGDFIIAFSDVDGDVLQKIKVASLPTSGTLFLGSNAVTANQEIAIVDLANLTFTPATNFSGSASFEWNGFDGTVYATENSTVTLNLAGVNDVPSVKPVNKTGTEGTPVPFTVNDFQNAFVDPDGDLINKIQVISLPTNGTLLLGSNPVALNQEIARDELANLTFTPDANFNGTISFSWNGSDGALYAGTSNTVNLTITPVNAAPTLGVVTKASNEDTTLVFTAADFTGVFSDLDGDPLSKIQITSLPNNGSLLLSGAAVTVGQEIAVADLGSLTFAPGANFNGAVSFGWNGSDGMLYATNGSTVDLTINSVNDIPTVGSFSKTSSENTPIPFTAEDFTGVFSDIEGQPLQKIKIVTLPTNGTLLLSGVAVTADLEIAVANLGNLTFSPATSFNGITNFTWTGSDGFDYAVAPSTVSLSIGSVNDPPIVSPIAKTGTEDDPSIPFAAADFVNAYSDIENDSLTKIQITSLPANGTLLLNGAPVTANQEVLAADLGNLSFVPTANFSGSTSFNWNASDGSLYALGGSTVTIAVTPVNDPPTVGTVSRLGSENIAIAFTASDFTGAFTDIDNDALNKIQITSLPVPASGTLSLNGTAVTLNQEIAAADLAKLTFTPATSFNGAVTFGWNGSDGTVYAGTPGTVNINIDAVNDAPTVININKTGSEDAPISFTLSDFTASFSDVDGNTLNKIQITTLPTNGTLKLGTTDVTLNQEIAAAELANLTFTPAANFNGAVSFNWNGSDSVLYATTGATVNLAINAVNDVPVVNAISKTGSEDTAIPFTASDFTTAFADIEGGALSKIQITALSLNGTLLLNGAAVTLGQEVVAADLDKLSFVPAANFNGNTSFGWNGSDGTDYAPVASTVNVAIAPINDPPLVSNVSRTTDENVAIVFTAADFANAFSDPDGNSLTQVKITSLPTNGTLLFNNLAVAVNQEIAIAEIGSLSFTPATNFNGIVNFGWNGSDGTFYSATDAAINLTINPINTAPSVGAIAKTGNEDESISFAASDFATAFSDVDNDLLNKIKILSLPTNGTLQLNGTNVTVNQEIAVANLGSLLFVPAANFNGTASFEWNGSDGAAYAVTGAAVSLNITAVNDAPVVGNFSKSGNEDTPIAFAAFDFINVFNDPDGQPLASIQITSLPTNGILRVNGLDVVPNQDIAVAALDTLTFTPAAFFNGAVSFNWNGSDGTTYAVNAGAVDLVINSVNNPPTVNTVTAAGTEDTPFVFSDANFIAAFSDVDGNPLNKIKITSLPANGVLTLGGNAVAVDQEIALAELGTLVFTPAANFSGTASFGWTASDGTFYATTPGTVEVAIAPINDPPTVVNIAKTGNEDAAITFTAGDFAGAFSDVDSDALNKIKITALPTNGTLALNGAAVSVDQEIAVADLGTLTFTPAANFNGTVSFGWNGSDSALYAATGTTVNITINGVNDAPVISAVNKAGTEDVAIAFAANDFIGAFADLDGGSLNKIQITSLPTNGVLQFNGVNVTLNQEIATAALDTLTFTPAANANGTISFGWNGSNGTAYATAATTVNLNLAPVNDAPGVINISKATNEDVAIALKASDFAGAFGDIDGNPLSKVQITSLPSNGTLTLNGAAVALNQEIAVAELDTLTFTPAAFFNGAASFTWNGSDGAVYAATGAAVNLTINPVNNAPAVGTIAKTANEDTAIAFTASDFTGAFSDVDGNPLNKIQITSLPANGVLTVNGVAVTANQEIAAASLGSLTFTPAANFNGAVSFGWNASDGALYAATAGTINLTINAVADAPVVSAINKTGTEDASVAFSANDFITAFTDADGGTLTKIRFTTLPVTGALKLNGAAVAINQEIAVAALNTLTFTPNANVNGPISFGWNGADETGYAVAGAAVNVNLAPANDRPTVNAISKTVNEDTVITFAASDFAATFSDIDGDPLNKIQITSLPTNGTLALNGAAVTLNQEIAAANLGSLTFTPNATFNGAVSFNWNGSDGALYAATGSAVNLTFTPVNNAPTVGTIAKTGTEDGGAILFAASDFTAVFSDVEGDPLSKIQITSLPANGVLTLNGVAVTVNQEIAVANLGTLSFTPNANANGTASFGWNGSDGALYATTPGTVNLSIAPTNDAPTVTNVSKVANENITITFAASDFAAAFADIDNDPLNKIQITSLPANGVLKLNGTDVTLNQEIAAANLGSLTFAPTANFSGAVSFGWTGSDGAVYAVGGATVNLTINAVNDPPVVAGFSRTGTEDAPIAFTSNAFTGAFSDIDGNSLNKIQITALPTNGVLKLNGATVALNQEIAVTALDSLAFVPNANFSGTDSFGWNGSDGALYAGAGAVVNLTVNPVADAPVIAGTTGSLSYAEGAGAVAIDGGFAIADPDSPDMGGATVAITNFDPTQDSLGFTAQPGITGTINGGTLTLTGTAPLASYLAALRSVTYTNSSTSPDTTPRTVQFTVKDSTNAVSNVVSRIIQIVPDASSPVLTPSTGALRYIENSGLAVVDNGVTLADSDSVLLGSATAAIVGYAPGSQETLGFNAQNGISGSFNPATGVLTLVGLSALANYQNALRSVTYTNNSDNPNPTARTVQFSVSDESFGSSSASRQIQVIPVNDAPVVVPPRGTIPYSKNLGRIVLDDTLTVVDPDSANLTGATVAVVNYLPGQGGLQFTNQNNISGSFNDSTGVLTLTGTTSVGNYETALRSITFVHNNATPVTLPQFVQFRVNDGTLTSDAATGTLQVVFENTSPVLDLNGSEDGIDVAVTGPAAGGPVKVVGSNLSLTDIDSSTISSATIAIADPVAAVQERLSADTTGTDISASYNPDLGILSLTGSASIEAYQQVLRTITYSSSVVDPGASLRTIAFTVNDGEKNSAIATAKLSLTDSGSSGSNGGELGVSLVTTPIKDVINAPGSNDRVTSILANLQQDDLVDGGVGTDTLVLTDGTGTAFVNVGNTTNQLTGITPAGTRIANFERFDFSGFTGNVMMTGSDGLNDALTGGSGNDALVGGGGNDNLTGNAGNDTMSDSAGNDVMDGGAGDDRLNGGGGDDRLIGGAGKNWFRGGKGKDSFQLDAKKDGVDVVTDFKVADDTIFISKSASSNRLKMGTMRATQFTLGSSAHDKSDRFIYNCNTGALFFDADGMGGTAQIQIARLSNKATITRADIVVVA